MSQGSFQFPEEEICGRCYDSTACAAPTQFQVPDTELTGRPI